MFARALRLATAERRALAGSRPWRTFREQEGYWDGTYEGTTIWNRTRQITWVKNIALTELEGLAFPTHVVWLSLVRFFLCPLVEVGHPSLSKRLRKSHLDRQTGIALRALSFDSL
jgi:hypothetical protein